MELTEFLLARIAEDEAVAREATLAQFSGFADAPDAVWRVDYEKPIYTVRGVRDVGRVVRDRAAHVARHDPARVLAECEAKRRIVARSAPLADMQVRRQTRNLACDTLRALALPYRDHPDFDPAWAD